MSGSRLARDSPDLARLAEDGHAIRLLHGYFVVDDIHFVADDATIRRGSFLCPLDVNGDRTAKPSNYLMCFAGGDPRAKNAQPIDGLAIPGVEHWTASPDLAAACGFSRKPDPTGTPTSTRRSHTTPPS